MFKLDSIESKVSFCKGLNYMFRTEYKMNLAMYKSANT